MAIITVRKLDKNWDPMRGSGSANFLSDIEAVGQTIASTIKLLQNEWFENRLLGTPLFQRLLGHPITSQGVALILRKRILSVPYVTGISNFGVTVVRSGRTFTFSALVQTTFGPIAVSKT